MQKCADLIIQEEIFFFQYSSVDYLDVFVMHCLCNMHKLFSAGAFHEHAFFKCTYFSNCTISNNNLILWEFA